MKLLFQSDDYGITNGVSAGIRYAIENGLVRSSGLFVNMPSSLMAASYINNYPDVCFGIDINLVAGKPVSEISKVSSLVDENGYFYSSGYINKHHKLLRNENGVLIFEEDPYNYEETLYEVENQVKKFIEYTGKKPGYIHTHSLSTLNTRKAIEEVALKYDLKVSYLTWKANGYKRVKVDWNPKPFPFEDQLNTDVETKFIEALEKCKDEEKMVFVCHCGYMDHELFQCSTYTAIRTKDLINATSDRVKKYISDNHIEIVNYDDLD